MSNSSNFDNYVDLLIQSNDDYEPYGMTTQLLMASEQHEYMPLEFSPPVETTEYWRSKY